MIADSPYDVHGRVLSPTRGALAMLGLLAAAAPLGSSLTDGLDLIGGTIMSSSGAAGTWRALVGAGMHVLCGSLFGLLYAVCQQRTSTRNLIAVGVFYGFLLWVVGGYPLGFLYGDELRTFLRSWTWLATSLLFGLVLALASIRQGYRAHAGGLPAPRPG